MHNNDFVNEIYSEFGACSPRPGDTECRSSVSCAAQGQRACPEGIHSMLPIVLYITWGHVQFYCRMKKLRGRSRHIDKSWQEKKQS